MARRLKRFVAFALTLVIFVAMGVELHAFVVAQTTDPDTDDASIDADVVHVAPTVSGRVVDLPIQENQNVRRGDLLFAIDPQPYQLRVDLAVAELAQSKALLDTKRRSVATQSSAATIAASQVTQARDSLNLASNTLARIQPLLPKGYVSQQQVDDARTSKEKAVVAYSQAEVQAQASQAAIDTLDAAMAEVQAAKSRLALARRDLRETKVVATHAGRVTGLAIKSGEYATVSQSLFTLVVSEEWYASANFRETELKHIAVGACARAFSLIDRSVAIKGRVESIGFGVRDQDRINLPRGVPYVEKSVNWVRVEQRFPVRVKLESPPEALMRLGASAVVQIRNGERC